MVVGTMLLAFWRPRASRSLCMRLAAPCRAVDHNAAAGLARARTPRNCRRRETGNLAGSQPHGANHTRVVYRLPCCSICFAGPLPIFSRIDRNLLIDFPPQPDCEQGPFFICVGIYSFGDGRSNSVPERFTRRSNHPEDPQPCHANASRIGAVEFELGFGS
jgi:hypothetical protein